MFSSIVSNEVGDHMNYYKTEHVLQHSYQF